MLIFYTKSKIKYVRAPDRDEILFRNVLIYTKKLISENPGNIKNHWNLNDFPMQQQFEVITKLAHVLGYNMYIVL